MTDINTIKNLLYFVPYLKTETWYMLGIGVTIYAIYIAYLIAFERYYKAQQSTPDMFPRKESILQTLSSIRIEDIRFFEKLSFVVRSYLEESNQVPLATKKTRKDIHSETVSLELKEVLDICTHYEYAPEQATEETKRAVLQRLRGIV